MKIVVLDRQTLGDDLNLKALQEFGEVIEYATTKEEECKARVESADIIITNKVVLDREIMESTSSLKLICIAATGTNNVDLDVAKKLKITVKNVSNYSTTSVVQHTFSMMFYLLNKLEYYNTTVKNGEWSKSNLFTDVSQPFFELHRKKWGIIGLGNIGKEVARIAELFGATIHYYSTSGRNLINDYHHSELNTLLAECDIVSIHAPLNDATHNLINHSNLPLLKEKAILLNLGRGGIVNETDLATELNRRNIYAGLDVLEHEPIEKTNPLLSIQNPNRLLITPHIAWTSIEARKKLLEGIVKNIRRFIATVKV